MLSTRQVDVRLFKFLDYFFKKEFVFFLIFVRMCLQSLDLLWFAHTNMLFIEEPVE